MPGMIYVPVDCSCQSAPEAIRTILFIFLSSDGLVKTKLDPFRTAVPFLEQTSQILSILSPKRDCGSKLVGLTTL